MTSPGAQTWTKAELVRIVQQQLDATIQPKQRTITDVPIGVPLPFAGVAAPEGYLFCDGSVYPQSGYPDLFDVIGTLWNTGGEAADQFRVVDLRGKVIIGAGGAYTLAQTGGVDSVTLSSSQIPSHTHPAGSFAVGSEASHTHPTPAHLHQISAIRYSTNATHTHQNNTGYVAEAADPNTGAATASATDNDGSGTSGAGSSHTHPFSGTSGSTGGGGSHENRMPFVVLNAILKF